MTSASFTARAFSISAASRRRSASLILRIASRIFISQQSVSLLEGVAIMMPPRFSSTRKFLLPTGTFSACARTGHQSLIFNRFLGFSRRHLQPRINRLALQSQDAEDALMHPAQRLLADETLQPFDTEGEFAE